MRLFVFALSVALLSTTPAAAWWVSGHGSLQCGEWLEGRKGNSLNTLGASTWLQGFLSGYNFSLDTQVGRDVKYQSIEAFVDKYCRENPLGKVADAAVSLVEKLSKK